MSGRGRTAIARMLRIPRPRRYRPLWLGLPIAAVVGRVSFALTGATALAWGAVVGGGVASLACVALMIGRLWTWTAIALVVGLGLGAVPLLGVLGFELAVIAS